jgi:hypothetical protein
MQTCRAVLLDKFTEASMQSKADEAAAQRALQMRLESMYAPWCP